MMGIDFNKERENKELRKDKNFKDSIWDNLGYTEYLCPKCPAHLKEAEGGDLICLNGCHMTEGMRLRFSSEMKKIANKLLKENK